MSDPQPFTIAFDYDKAAAHPVGYGYDLMSVYQPLLGITLHSTEHGRGQSFAAVCRYGRDSAAVSWHYTVGVDGEIQRLLDPGPYRAWHAGASVWAGKKDCNSWSVGIELFHRVGDGEYPPAQLMALTWLVRTLMTDHPTITAGGIHAHRWCALPAGRKADPSGLTDFWLKDWIAAL